MDMSANYRIYLDVCCLNRPFDNQSQPRIALETQAILSIINQCEIGQWKLMTSAAIDAELNQTPNLERLSNVKTILTIAKIRVVSSQALNSRARELQRLGFTGYDVQPILLVPSAVLPMFSYLPTIDSPNEPSATHHLSAFPSIILRYG